MSDLTFNKIAGAVLVTALAIVGLREVSAGVFSKEPPAKPGYLIEVAEDTSAGGGEAADVPPDWGTVLPKADVKAGEEVFAKCKSCHNADNGGPNGTGPNLWGVEGRKPGSHPGFAYSSGMTDFGGKQPVWDYEHIYEFIKAPQKYINGTKMTFIGLKKPEDRINVIAYLRGQGGTLPVPPPNPAAAAAPAAGAASGATPAGADTTGGAKPTATGSTANPPSNSGGPTNSTGPAQTGSIPKGQQPAVGDKH